MSDTQKPNAGGGGSQPPRLEIPTRGDRVKDK